MGTSVIRTYRPIPSAVLPGTAVRGGLLGILYVPVGLVLLAYLDSSLEGTVLNTLFAELHAAIGFGGIMAIGFAFPVVATLFLAFVGYSRRRYELGTDGITERRGLLFTSERFLAYDDVEEVLLTQSKMQSLYGTGTIRLADVDENEEVERRMKLSYIESPGTVYTNILRNVADPDEAGAGGRDDPDVGEMPMRTEDISRLSGDSLAAGTGFEYLMPSAVLHPEPWEAGKHGGLDAAGHAVIGVATLYVLKSLLMRLLPIPSEAHFKAFLALGFVAYVLALGGWSYWNYDRMQYELYDDHIRFIDGGERTTVALGDVADLEARAGTMRMNDVGHVALLEADGNDLLVFEFVTDPDATRRSLDEWIGSAE